jgi:asparagine synthase (glutamine-hydrolysing)
MCGIAGIVDLSGSGRHVSSALSRMADAMVHRGPDDEGYLHRPGLGLACRRLSIVGLTDGHQPIWNEDRTVATVFNGELFDYPALKTRLQSRGHRFSTGCDTELIPHLWEDHQELLFEHLRGQFAFAVYDERRRRLVVGRDRFGICPLYWSRQTSAAGDWLLFASEVKALLASGLVDAAPDLRGLDQVFHFFAVPGPATCFRGVSILQPGCYLSIDLGRPGATAAVEGRSYWTIGFPESGREEDPDQRDALVDRFERLMLGAVERRLRADVPVAAYLSGGIDSSLVVAMAARIRGNPPPTFTVRVKARHYDESGPAGIVARHVGAHPVVVPVGEADVLDAYPDLVQAAEAPVIDTASAAALMLAREVHRHGYKVALAGEGSDEWLGGYPWHKVHRLLGMFDVIPGVPLSRAVRRLLSRIVGTPPATRSHARSIFESLGHFSAFHDVYSLMTASRFIFFSDAAVDALREHNPYLALEPDLDRINRWHGLNQSAYWAARIHLPGHLLSLKGDRVAMASSVEMRYPFLDEDVFGFLAALHPRWRLRGFRDKYILRLVGERYLPSEIAWRRKVMFRAPMDSFFVRRDGAIPPFVDELLSEDSLRKTGWFNVRNVHAWRDRLRSGAWNPRQRLMVQLGMVGVVSSQLWYHTFIDGTLADLPSYPRARSLRETERPLAGAQSSTEPAAGLA